VSFFAKIDCPMNDVSFKITSLSTNVAKKLCSNEAPFLIKSTKRNSELLFFICRSCGQILRGDHAHVSEELGSCRERGRRGQKFGGRP